MEIIIDVTGWIGTCLIISAYYLISSKRLDGGSKTYQALNLFGAAGIGFNVFYHHAWPAFAMEIAWAAIAVYALVKNK